MTLPEGQDIGYECENGHINADHDIDHAAEDGKKCVCSDCGALLTKTVIPVYHCRDCGNTWAYAGDADRPTCSSCKSKAVAPVASN